MSSNPELQCILQIEDDDDILEISRIAIELTVGLTLLQARTGREALEVLSGIRPDVILLDVMMPDMDGPETLGHIRDAGFGSVPVIFLTARARTEDIKSLKALGVVGVLLKPFDPMTLIEQVREMVGKRLATTAALSVS